MILGFRLFIVVEGGGGGVTGRKYYDDAINGLWKGIMLQLLTIINKSIYLNQYFDNTGS